MSWGLQVRTDDGWKLLMPMGGEGPYEFETEDAAETARRLCYGPGHGNSRVVELTGGIVRVSVGRNRNLEALSSFVHYCKANPDQRFWQALRNWTNASKVLIEPVGGGELVDTFFWERRDG